MCAEWNKDLAPAKIFGNTYSVGTDGLSALLVTSPAGHVLLDAALPQSAPLIDQHIRALGFKTEDIKLILVSHGHYDHAGGVAALQRFSGARVGASPSTAAALRASVNTPDDPQVGFGPKDNGFPPVATVQELKDGEVVRVGDVAITVHHIPGHAPGSTAYTGGAAKAPRARAWRPWTASRPSRPTASASAAMLRPPRGWTCTAAAWPRLRPSPATS